MKYLFTLLLFLSTSCLTQSVQKTTKNKQFYVKKYPHVIYKKDLKNIKH